MSTQKEQPADVFEKVGFCLYAPGKAYVSVVGSFNDWDTQNFPLEAGDDGFWRGEREILQTVQRYQFFIRNQDGTEFYLTDPYSRKVNWETRRRQPESVLELGNPQYEWSDQNFKIPKMNEAIIYEIHVGNFSQQGNLRGVTERLEYLKELGINVIELMPLTEFFGTGDDDWGYEPAFYFAIEKSYGSEEDLKELVNKAHSLGIAVVLDVVFNHCGHNCPLVLLYEGEDNIYLSSDGNEWGLPDLNHWHDATKRFLSDVQEYWLREFHIDGFRYDNTSNIKFDENNGMTFLAAQARKVKPEALLIAENMEDPTADIMNTEVQSSWHDAFIKSLTPLICERELEGRLPGDIEGAWQAISFGFHGYSDHAQAINYFENHDQERLTALILEKESLRNDDALWAKLKLALVTLFTAAGVPLLYAGQELALENKRTLQGSKINWSKSETEIAQKLRELITKLTNLRRKNNALKVNPHELLWKKDDPLSLAFKRWDDNGNIVLSALNFSPVEIQMALHFPESGVWQEYLSGQILKTQESKEIALTLPPSGAQIWISNGSL